MSNAVKRRDLPKRIQLGLPKAIEPAEFGRPFKLTEGRARRRILDRCGVDILTASDEEMMLASLDMRDAALEADRSLGRMREAGDSTEERRRIVEVAGALARACVAEIDRQLVMRHQQRLNEEHVLRLAHAELVREKKQGAAWAFMATTMAILGRDECARIWDAAREKFPDAACWEQMPEVEAIEKDAKKHLRRLRERVTKMRDRIVSAVDQGSGDHALEETCAN